MTGSAQSQGCSRPEFFAPTPNLRAGCDKENGFLFFQNAAQLGSGEGLFRSRSFYFVPLFPHGGEKARSIHELPDREPDQNPGPTAHPLAR